MEVQGEPARSSRGMLLVSESINLIHCVADGSVSYITLDGSDDLESEVAAPPLVIGGDKLLRVKSSTILHAGSAQLLTTKSVISNGLSATVRFAVLKPEIRTGLVSA